MEDEDYVTTLYCLHTTVVRLFIDSGAHRNCSYSFIALVV